MPHRLAAPFRARAARACGVILWLAAVATAPAWAAEELPFRWPSGWMPEAAAVAGMKQAGRDFEQGHAAILASGPLPREESLEAALTRILAGMPGAASPPDARGAGVTAGGHRLAFERRAGSEGVLDAVAMDDGVSRVVLLLQGRALAPRRALMARDAFDLAVRSVRPGSDVPAPVPPEDAGGLNGAFTGLRFVHRPNGEGDTEVLADIWVLLFDRSGLFSRVAPAGDGGVAAHCRVRPADCGTYSLLGGGWLRSPDRIRLRDGAARYGLVEVRDLPFLRQDAALRIDGTALTAAAVPPAGATLQGSWTGGTVSSEGSVEQQLTLGTDGRFRREVETLDIRQGRTTSITTGAYQLEGYQLLLEGDDGARESHGLLQPDPGSDSVLLIDGEAYLKRAADPGTPR